MKQLQFYKYATWGLLILNLSMVVFFFLTAPPRPKGSEIGRGKASEVLKLDTQQGVSFLQLAQAHMKQMDDFNNQQRDILQPYFKSLIKQNNSIDPESLLDQVQLMERRKIESVYQHFQDVKSILRPDQYEYFDGFIEHAIERILLDEKNNPPPPGGN